MKANKTKPSKDIEGVEPLKRSRQMSNSSLSELIRPYVPELIQRALMLVVKSDNDNVKLGAIKLLIGKVLPDLKATEITGEKTGAFELIIRNYTVEAPVDGKPEPDSNIITTKTKISS